MRSDQVDRYWQMDESKSIHPRISPGATSVSTTYTMPPIVSVEVPSLQAAISIDSSLSVSIDQQSSALAYDEALWITPKAQQTADWYLRVLYSLRILLSLLVGRPVHVSRVQLCTESEKKPETSSKAIYSYVDLCMKQVGNREEKDILPQAMPFPYPMLSDDWPQMLDTWFSKSQSLNTLAGLFFGVSVDRSIPFEFQFLSLIQGIESYHRTHGDDTYVSDKDYEPIKQALLEAIPTNVNPDHREALKGRIKYGNEYSLRKRLEITMQSIPESLTTDITNKNKKFITQVVATRNYLTHRDETGKADVLDFAGMFDVSVSLKVLTEFLLLREVGMPVDKLCKVMTTHSRYKNRPKIL